MSFKVLMIIKALVCLSFGLAMLAVPEFLFSIFGIQLGAGGLVPTREYGAAMIGILLITWFARNAKASDARKAIIMGLCVYDAIGFVVFLVATLTGVANALGWLVVVLYLFLAVAFGYFWWKAPKP